MNAKNKGNAYEQKLARELREHGWTNCETSRYASKRTDDSGIDFVGTGCFAIQAKATERTPTYSELLARMVKAESNKINLIFHKRNNKLETVTMLKTDAYVLMSYYDRNYMTSKKYIVNRLKFLK